MKIGSRSSIRTRSLPCPGASVRVPNLVRIRQIFLQILSGNHLSSVVASNDLCDLENEVKVTWFEVGLRLALLLQSTKFGDREDMSNIS